MTTWAPAGRDLGDEHAQLLVGERPAQLAVDAAPAVVEQDRLDPAGRLEVGDRGRRRLLAAVAGVGEQRDVAGAGAPEVLAEPADERVAGGGGVDQHPQVEVAVGARLEVRLERGDVVAAAVERR